MAPAKNFPFDPKTAFAPITLKLTSDVALVLAVHPSLPVHDVTELIEYAKKNPGKARSVLIAMPLDSQGLFTTPRL